MQNSEVLLTAIFLSLYLYDSVLLLYSNEAILTPRGKDEWFVGFGSNKTTLKGKEVYLPLWPTKPLFRLAWKFEDAEPDISSTWTAKRDAFSRFVPLVWSLAAITFVLLPFALFGRRGDLVILLSFMLIYVNVLLIVFLLWLDRHKFGLTGKSFAVMALDLLICPPFALNIIRRLSLRVPVQEDLIHAARRLQTSDAWELTRVQVLARLDDEIASEDEDTSRMAALLKRRNSLNAEARNVLQ